MKEEIVREMQRDAPLSIWSCASCRFLRVRKALLLLLRGLLPTVLLHRVRVHSDLGLLLVESGWRVRQCAGVCGGLQAVCL